MIASLESQALSDRPMLMAVGLPEFDSNAGPCPSKPPFSVVQRIVNAVCRLKEAASGLPRAPSWRCPVGRTGSAGLALVFRLPLQFEELVDCLQGRQIGNIKGSYFISQGVDGADEGHLNRLAATGTTRGVTC